MTTPMSAQDTEVLEMLARKAHAAAIKGSSITQQFEDLPTDSQDRYRAIASAVLDGMAPHITALVHAFGNKALQAEHKAQTLSGQLYEAREWALQEQGDRATLHALLKEAQPLVQKAKWQGDLAAGSLSERIEKKLEEVDNG